jgi:hypothetical protein
MTKCKEAGDGLPPSSRLRDFVVKPTDVEPVLSLVQRDPTEGAALRRPLLRAAQAIFNAACEAQAIPRRRELVEKLKNLKIAAKVVAKLVLDPTILAIDPGIQETFGTPEGLDVSSAMARLIHIVDRHTKRLNAAAGQKGPMTAAHLYGRHSARLLCATVIVEAWRQLRGRPPAATTVGAQNACAELWRAAGGQRTEAVEQGNVCGGAGASWERHLKKARRPDPKRPDHALILQQAADIFFAWDANRRKT